MISVSTLPHSLSWLSHNMCEKGEITPANTFETVAVFFKIQL